MILRFHGSPATATTRPPTSLDERRVVGAVAAGGVGRAQHVGAERLRRLHGDERSRGRASSTTAPSSSTSLIVSVTGTAGTTPSAPATHGVDHARRTGRRSPAGGRVVHADDRRPSAGTAARPARTDSLRVVDRRPRRASGRRRPPAGRQHDDHAVAAARARVATATIEHAPAAERLVLLGAAEPPTPAASHDDGPDDLAGDARGHTGQGSTVAAGHGHDHAAYRDILADTDFFADADARHRSTSWPTSAPSASSCAATCCSTRATRPTRCTS